MGSQVGNLEISNLLHNGWVLCGSQAKYSKNQPLYIYIAKVIIPKEIGNQEYFFKNMQIDVSLFINFSYFLVVL